MTREIRARAARAGLLAALAGIAGCARQAEPTTYAVPTYAVPTATAADIRLRCPAGSFMGTMTVTCPQVVK